MTWSLFALIAGVAIYLVLLRELWVKPYSEFTDSWTFFSLLSGSLAGSAVGGILLLLPWLKTLPEETQEWLPLTVVLPLLMSAYALIFLALSIRDKARRREREARRP